MAVIFLIALIFMGVLSVSIPLNARCFVALLWFCSSFWEGCWAFRRFDFQVDLSLLYPGILGLSELEAQGLY